jgi:acetyltransferase-like isoleucine patch superfamily enzyme
MGGLKIYNLYMYNFSLKRRIQKIKNKCNLFYQKRIKKSVYTKDILFNKWVTVDQFTYGEPQILVFNGNATANVYIGKFCSIAKNVEIFTGGNHNTNWITTYPFSEFTNDFSEGEKVKGFPSTKGDVHIGNDVWIGRGAVIMSGVTIGNGAVIGAYTIVSKNIGPYEIAVGNPMRIIKKRFTVEIIEKLEAIKWWDWELQKIQKEVTNLCSSNIDDFIKKHY